MGVLFAEDGHWYACTQEGCKVFKRDRYEVARHYEKKHPDVYKDIDSEDKAKDITYEDAEQLPRSRSDEEEGSSDEGQKEGGKVGSSSGPTVTVCCFTSYIVDRVSHIVSYVSYFFGHDSYIFGCVCYVFGSVSYIFGYVSYICGRVVGHIYGKQDYNDTDDDYNSSGEDLDEDDDRDIAKAEAESPTYTMSEPDTAPETPSDAMEIDAIGPISPKTLLTLPPELHALAIEKLVVRETRHALGRQSLGASVIDQDLLNGHPDLRAATLDILARKVVVVQVNIYSWSIDALTEFQESLVRLPLQRVSPMLEQDPILNGRIVSLTVSVHVGPKAWNPSDPRSNAPHVPHHIPHTFILERESGFRLVRKLKSQKIRRLTLDFHRPIKDAQQRKDAVFLLWMFGMLRMVDRVQFCGKKLPWPQEILRDLKQVMEAKPSPQSVGKPQPSAEKCLKLVKDHLEPHFTTGSGSEDDFEIVLSVLKALRTRKV
ncbi:uncharacterized protein AB675_8701 [Cyphellophora attinorum]|uniref:Uncharacterized protein n=1 Tax=Cyphellophora attinorum TaxID=1664694 RepID=A0A0N1HFV4_9EURO|nr:uncharacterized protein AB675_8701 [Phialophora attinorum]KPI44792.1 hypothetical protein AB675_8701 [Phialophora attinorum]